jgi:hypothetical protein
MHALAAEEVQTEHLEPMEQAWHSTYYFSKFNGVLGG